MKTKEQLADDYINTLKFRNGVDSCDVHEAFASGYQEGISGIEERELACIKIEEQNTMLLGSMNALLFLIENCNAFDHSETIACLEKCRNTAHKALYETDN